MDMKNLQVRRADLADEQDQQAILELMDAYSQDPMGDSKPLSDFARENLLEGLRKHPTSLIFLANLDGRACGIATCFLGFSTFAARPLVNISDFYVEPHYRGKGVGRKLLEHIAAHAKELGCCKLTLEVQQNNSHARSIYARFGFAQAVYAADAESGGGSLYMIKPLDFS